MGVSIFMAVMLEFIDLIVPIETIREKYPGGWAACLEDHEAVLGSRVWHDDYLFRDGTMSPRDMESLVQYWAQLGLQASEVRNGQTVWKDLCVVECMFGGATQACDWLVVDRKQRTAYLKGTDPGKVVGSAR